MDEPQPEPVADLVRRLITGGSWDRWEHAVDAAVGASEAGEAALAYALPLVTRDRRVGIAAALGDTRGPAGAAALREAALGTGASQDLRCAALLALAKREGPAATPALLDGLALRNTTVKEYALIGLCRVGDDAAWEPVFQRLEQMLTRPIQQSWPVSAVVRALCFLGSRAGADQRRRERTVALIRSRWSSVLPDARAWLHAYWPAAAPSGPSQEQVPPPDATELAAYLQGDPLFEPLNGPSWRNGVLTGRPRQHTG
ncbi:MAG TPA: hypothetical protein VFR07_07990 [Mycobacteriales bacterium]|nr:hypothetical protein [Mycobacteriales bacterium]